MSDLLTQEEMNDIGLEPDQVNVLKKCFDGFADEDGAIPADNVGNILSMMGLKVKPSALKDIIEEIDEDGKPFRAIFIALVKSLPSQAFFVGQWNDFEV